MKRNRRIPRRGVQHISQLLSILVEDLDENARSAPARETSPPRRLTPVASTSGTACHQHTLAFAEMPGSC